MKIYNSTHNFFRGENLNSVDKLVMYNKYTEIDSIELIKNEEFGFFVTFISDNKCYVNLENEYDLPWWGLDKRYRVKVESDLDISPHLIGYVKDDDGIEKADIILNEKACEFPQGEVPIFIEGRIPKDYDSESTEIVVKLYSSTGYEVEKLVCEKSITVKVINFQLDMNIDGSFYLDLWQHPSSWARVYGVEYFSDKHFEIIERYIKELAKLGQKVIDLVVSDFPWAGQMCFCVEKNHSRLYEYNIVNIKRKNGKIVCDFENMDRYIKICMNYGIKDEINIFGIIGNWHKYDFGFPIKSYGDPIRLKVYDEDKGVYDFIREKEELRTYIKLLFDHLDELGVLGITKVIGDEPSSNNLFIKYSNFLENSSGRKLSFKYALHNESFFEDYRGDLESFSINTILLGSFKKDVKKYNKLIDNSHKMTWYSCCFPKDFNIFIKNPLIEARYMGVYTYLWKLKGMLRWSYGLYVENISLDIRYKPEKWAAGDMFIVYPGKNGEIVHSLREKNMFYGIQDFNIFKKIDKKGMYILKELKNKLSMIGDINEVDGRVILDEYINIEDYKKIRNDMIKETLRIKNEIFLDR